MNEKKQILVKLFRLMIIAGMIVAFLVIGSKFPVLVQESKADIFSLFDSPERNIPDFREGSNQSDIGKTVVNGVPFAYSVEVVDATIDDVVDFYKETFNPDYYRVFPDSFLKQAGVEKGGRVHKVVEGMERIFSKMVSPVLTYKGDGYGFVAALDRGDNSKWFVEKTANIKEKVVGKAVIALKNSQESEKTTVIRYWTEGKFDLDKLIPDMQNDVEGFDIDDVDRHPYSVRILSMKQEDRFGRNNIVSYYIAEKTPAVLIYYLSDLRANNWEISESAIKGMYKAERPNYIYAKKEGRELNVFLTEDDDGGTIATFMGK
jgi:hypothetical protein